MNDNNVNTNQYSKDEPVKVMEAPQAVETWHAVENKDWQEQPVATTPDTVLEVEEPANPKAEVSAPVSWLKGEEVVDLQSRWNAIQIDFVDEPRKSVEQADALVVEALKRIEQGFTNQRTILIERWLNHEDIQTEDLRISLQSYRSFLNRILAL